MPNHISELHGNGNIEYCESCGQEYLRDFHCTRLVKGRDHYTGRHCVVPVATAKDGVCNGRLMNSTIDFGQSLPQRPLMLAEQNSKKADLHIVFGSSLTVSPACDMPRTTAKKGGRLVIVNLQKTPLFKLAKLNIRARCDEVMAAIMSKLDIPIPRWTLKREIIFNCQANSQESVLNVQGVDPLNRKLPHSVCKQLTFTHPPTSGLSSEVLSAKEPFRLRLKYKKEKKTSENNVQLKAQISWRGHYEEPAVSLSFPITLGKNKTMRYCLGYIPSLKTWEMTHETVSAQEVKEWSPLMHALMGTHSVEVEAQEEEVSEEEKKRWRKNGGG